MEREKGNRLEEYIDTFVVIDTETTNKNPCRAKIIELGAVKVKNWKIIDKFSCLVNPECDIPPSATKKNGITDEMVKDKNTIEVELPRFINFISNNIIVGHNIASYDTTLIYDIALKTMDWIFCNDFVDTLYLARRIHPELKNHRLDTLKDYYKITTDSSHRALEDCIATFQLYKNLYNDSEDTNILQNAREYKNKESVAKRNINNKNDFPMLENVHISYLNGKKVVITGSTEIFNLSRNDLKNLLENLGAYVTNNVSKKTDILIVGKNPGSKLKKAIDLDIKILSELELYKSLLDFLK